MMDGERTVWQAAIIDVPSMVSVAVSRYGSLIEDVQGVNDWLTANLQNKEILMLCSPTAYMITGIYRPFYAHKSPQAVILFVAGMEGRSEAPWHTSLMLVETARWAKERTAVVLKIDSETDIDLAPLVKRLGLPTKVIPGYTVAL